MKPPIVVPDEADRVEQERARAQAEREARMARVVAAVEASLTDEAVNRREAKHRGLARRIARREKHGNGRGW